MTSRDFCYWLQGFIEVGQPHIVTMEQLATIRAHLNMVFRHEIDPSFGKPEYIEELRKIHEGQQPEVFCVDHSRSTPESAKPTIVEQYPDGAKVELDPALTGLLPADWLAKLPKGGGDGFGGAMNC